MAEVFAIFMAVLAYSSISAGMVLMKKGINWIGWKGKKDRTYYENLFFWILGFLVMNLYGVPSAFALKVLPSHIVSAFAGWGVVSVILFSNWVLKERISLKEVLYSILIVSSITILNITSLHEAGKNEPDIFYLLILSAGPFILIPLLKFQKRIFEKAAFWGILAGISAGLMVVFLKLLISSDGYNIGSYIYSIWFWAYVTFALLSFFNLQVACKRGDMMEIGPAQYSANILWPLLVSIMAFNVKTNLLSVLLITLISFSVWGILKQRAL